jgi:hypothetical protein
VIGRQVDHLRASSLGEFDDRGADVGVWESGWWLGPTVSVAHRAADVDRYVELFEEFLSDVT